jgi:lysophospholipase L1-like esterase
MIRRILIATAIVAVFAAGVVIGRYRIIPFHILRAPAPAAPSAPEAFANSLSPLYVPMFEASTVAGRVVMLGNSLTAIADWRELFPATAIVNRGIPGDTTADILARLAPIVRDRPRAVFIMAGVNDFRKGRGVPETFDNYREIIATLAPATKAVRVQSTLAVDEAIMGKQGMNAKIAELNALLAAHCERSTLCNFIDLNSGMPGDARVDGVHLTPAGYKYWRDRIANVMAD